MVKKVLMSLLTFFWFWPLQAKSTDYKAIYQQAEVKALKIINECNDKKSKADDKYLHASDTIYYRHLRDGVTKANECILVEVDKYIDMEINEQYRRDVKIAARELIDKTKKLNEWIYMLSLIHI